jgi:hypothetical protein
VLVLRLGMRPPRPQDKSRTRKFGGKWEALPKEEIEALCGGAGQSVRFPPGSSGSGPRL